jgi:hypothetical protein
MADDVVGYTRIFVALVRSSRVPFATVLGINPSDLSWSGWFLCAIGAGTIAFIAHKVASEASQRKGGGGVSPP